MKMKMDNFILLRVGDIYMWADVPVLKKPMPYYEYIFHRKSLSIRKYMEYLNKISNENAKCIDFWNNEDKYTFNEDKTQYLYCKFSNIKDIKIS